MLLDTDLPLHGTIDYGLDSDAPDMADYTEGKLCPICGTLIRNDSRYCHKHAKMLDYLRPKIDRLIQRAQERRHAIDRRHA